MSQGDRPEKMTADYISFRGTPNGCSETNVSLQIDRAKLTWLPNVHEPLKDDANFSGMSGGPCFRLIPAENRIELAAIIYEGRWDIGIVFARPTTLISDEGIVAAAPPGVNRPEPEGD